VGDRTSTFAQAHWKRFTDVGNMTILSPAKVEPASFGDHLADTFLQAFPEEKTQYPDFLNKMARETLTHIGKSDAPYHNSEHTMMVTLVGQQIMQGKQKRSELHPSDWVHYIVALLLHDIGFTRGVCAGDTSTEVVINDAGERVCPPQGTSDASLARFHVDRGKIYARQRFADSDLIDPERVAEAIEYTRFPVPDDPAYICLDTEPALARAADLIGQIADPNYLNKLSALYHELLETGLTTKLGYSSPMDMVEKFPNFYHQQVEPLIGPAIAHLMQTSDGRELVAQVNAHVSQVSRRNKQGRPFTGR